MLKCASVASTIMATKQRTKIISPIGSALPMNFTHTAIPVISTTDTSFRVTPRVG